MVTGRPNWPPRKYGRAQATLVQSAPKQLRQIANDRRVPDHKKRLLGQLADALDAGTGLDRWAGVDLRTVFQPEETITRPIAGLWLARALEVLVFVPIVITWLGLMQASRVYRETLADPAMRTESFLQRWQTGFDGRLSPWLSFDHVALYTFSSIVLILVLAAAHFCYRSLLEGSLGQRLDSAVTEAELELAPVRLGQPSRVTAELDRVSAEIAAAAAQVREAGRIAGEAQSKAKGAITALVAALTKVEAGLSSMQTSADDVGKVSIDMGRHVAGVESAVQALSAAQTDLGSKTKTAGEQLKGVLNGLGDELKDAVAGSHQAMSAALGASSQQIADALSAGAGEVGAALTDVRATGAAYTSRVENAGDILGRAAETLEALPAAVARLEGLLRVLGDRAAALNNGLAAAKPASRSRIRLQTPPPPAQSPPPQSPPSTAPPPALSPPSSSSPEHGPDEQSGTPTQHASGPTAPSFTPTNQRRYSRIFRFRRGTR